MVDFKKLLDHTEITKPIDPIEIFNSLDKDSDKAYLWAAQDSVLREWNARYRGEKNTIVKLYTGQGKTLIGLLILQSFLNQGHGPALYLCPNNYLVSQTIQQAKSFGINTIEPRKETTALPREFLNSEAILVTTCKKLFNGKSVFGVDGSGREPVNIGCIVLDDAHKCLDIIRESFSVRIYAFNNDGRNPIFDEIFKLFEDSLKGQAPGTFADIYEGHDECVLAVPYWSWYEKNSEVLKILQKYKDTDELVFTWDLIKNHLEFCTCVFSGKRLEIVPRLLPINLFPSFSEAKRRIFLSATLTEDAFLIKDMDIEPQRVTNPLTFTGMKYSGERLILIPTIIDPSLSRFSLIKWISKLAEKNGSFGIFSIVPSKNHAISWEGSIVPTTMNIEECIRNVGEEIKKGTAKKVIVLVNRYDGIDLPGKTCQILCLDSLPSYNSLIDRYQQNVRAETSLYRRALAQRIEQGMGRGIRGSTDHCIVLIIGTDISEFLSENIKRSFLSPEAQCQIMIGEELAELLKEEGEPLKVIEKLIEQCLRRDEDWRKFYIQKMSKIQLKSPNPEFITRSILERNAELCFQKGQIDKAIHYSGQLIDSVKDSPRDLGWYLQLKAIYQYEINKSTAMDIQIRAFESNSKVFRPISGIRYSKLSHVGTNRARKIQDFIISKENPTAVILHINRVLENAVFGMPSDLFEEAIDEIGIFLGFNVQRPDKTYGEGPDNLWQVGDKHFWLIECKNEVATDRGISQDEATQLSGSISWFKSNYPDSKCTPIIIHPSKKFMSGASVIEPAYAIDVESLDRLKSGVKAIYTALTAMHRDSLSPDSIKEKLHEYQLDIGSMNQHFISHIKTD